MKFVDTCLASKLKTNNNDISNVTTEKQESKQDKLTNNSTNLTNKTNTNSTSNSTTNTNTIINTNLNKTLITELSKIQTNFSKENIKKELDDQYSNKVKHLKSKFEVSVQDLVKVNKVTMRHTVLIYYVYIII